MTQPGTPQGQAQGQTVPPSAPQGDFGAGVPGPSNSNTSAPASPPQAIPQAPQSASQQYQQPQYAPPPAHVQNTTPREGQLPNVPPPRELAQDLFAGMPGLQPQAQAQPQQPVYPNQPAGQQPGQQSGQQYQQQPQLQPAPGTPPQLVNPDLQGYQQPHVAAPPQLQPQQPAAQQPAAVQQPAAAAQHQPPFQPPANQQPSLQTPAQLSPAQQIQPQAQPQPQPQPHPLVDTLQRELGFQGLAPNDSEAATARLIAAYRQAVEQNRQYQVALMSAQPAAAQQPGAAAAAQVSAPVASPADPAARQVWEWKPPQIDEARIKKFQVTNEATGEIGWKPNTPPEIIAQAEAYEAHYQNWQRDLLLHPDKVLPLVIERYVPEIVEREIARRDSERREVEFQDSLVKNHPYLFEQDPVSGGPMVQNGRYVLSRVGQEIDAITQDYVGLGDRQLVLDTAIAMFERQHGPLAPLNRPQAAVTAQPTHPAQPAAPVFQQPQQLTPQQLQAASQQRRADHLIANNGAPPQIIPFPSPGQAAYAPNRNGTTPPSGSTPPGVIPAQLQNPGQGFKQFLLNDLTARGINLAAV